MILLYTGADSPDVPQINPEKSLGGFISSSPVPNGRLSNLFSSISKGTIQKDQKDIRLIALKNTTGVTVNNVDVYTNVTGGSIILWIAAVSPALNSCSQTVFEQLIDGSSLPYQAVVALHEGVGNKINIGSMIANAIIGIWIYRLVDQSKFPLLNTNALSCQDMATALLAEINPKEEEVQLIIDWT